MSQQMRNNHILALPFLQTAAEREQQPKYQLQYGLALAHENYYNEARDVFLSIIKTDSTQADALYNLGIIAFHENNKTTAKDYFKKAISAQPSHTLDQQALEQMKYDALEDEKARSSRWIMKRMTIKGILKERLFLQFLKTPVIIFLLYKLMFMKQGKSMMKKILN